MFDYSEIQGTFSLRNRRFERSHNKPIKLHRSQGITYKILEKANILFNEYIKTQKIDTSFIYKMELTGSQIYIKNVPCFVVEERKNSLVVIYKDEKIKTFIKNGLVFCIELNNIKYTIIGKNLKINRFIKR
ncbi:ribonuclease P protein component [Vairimorpha necatrix]|uniref:Ribonuclease P protein component n=1 Tax=Vairimorpha necatrix TaxID=6039 RepID=A0AAX4JB94_9MICR